MLFCDWLLIFYADFIPGWWPNPAYRKLSGFYPKLCNLMDELDTGKKQIAVATPGATTATSFL